MAGRSSSADTDVYKRQILILVVLIGLVLIFKDQLTSLVNDIFDTITKKAGKV